MLSHTQNRWRVKHPARATQSPPSEDRAADTCSMYVIGGQGTRCTGRASTPILGARRTLEQLGKEELEGA